MHGPPLEQAFVHNPPKLMSRYLTVGTPDANGAGRRTSTGSCRSIADRRQPRHARRRGRHLGAASRCRTSARRATSSDYTGQLRVRAEYRRQTDRENAVGGSEPAPTPPRAPTRRGRSPSSASRPRTPTSAPTATSRRRVDAITPGTIKESKRAISQLGRIEVWDGGSDGNVADPGQRPVRRPGHVRPVDGTPGCAQLADRAASSLDR